MVISYLLDINQHEKKLCCAVETSEEVHIYKLHIALDNTSPHVAWHGKNPSIHEFRTFGCDI